MKKKSLSSAPKLERSNLVQLERWFQDAFRCHEQGDFSGAEKLYQQILAKRSQHPQTLYLLGTLHTQRGDHTVARDYLLQALEQNSNWPEALNNLGLAYFNLGELTAAETHLRQALELKPNYPDALNNLAGVYEKQGQLEDAMALYRRTVELTPNNANIHYNLGLLLKRLSRLEESALAFERAIKIDPRHYEACNTLATIYKTLDRLDDAEQWLRRALTIYPNYSDAHNNLAAVMQTQDRIEEAMVEYDKALALRHDPLVQWNRAFILLALGNLHDGWIAYEWRRPVFNWQELPFSEWDGSSLTGKTLLVFAEQGLGDELLFASFFPELLDQAEKCIFECDRRLAPLYQRSFPTAIISGVMRNDRNWLTKLPPIDYQIPAGSIARYLRPSVDHFPSRPGYLIADPERSAQWRARFAALGNGLKIGITWRSGLTHQGRHRNYSRINDWGAVFAIPGVQFINLQYDDCSAELELAQRLFGINIFRFPEVDLFNDLDGAAALTAALDLVIAAGNAAGEIAAALGIPTFRIETYGRTWTSLGTDQFPWHPRTRVFRQARPGDWSELFDRIAAALRIYLGNQALKSGQLEAAERQYREILATNPQSAEAQNNFGSLLFEQGRIEAAISNYRAALQIRADFPEAHFNLANALYQNGATDAALAEYHQALQLRPDYSEARANLARVLQELGQIDAAEKEIQLALTSAPDLPEAHHNLGMIRQIQGRFDAAEIAYREALKLRPHFSSALINLANVLRESGKVEEAIIPARRALELAPDEPKALTVLADILHDLNQFDAAGNYYRRSLEIKDDLAVRRNFSLSLLAVGQLREGWRNYAARKIQLNPLPLTCPEWSGTALTDKSILILPEQGLGDELLFASCLDKLIPVAGKCVLVCDQRLANLYSRSFPQITVITQPSDYPLDKIDFQLRSGDLPGYFCPEISNFDKNNGYLIPDPTQVALWRTRLADFSGLKIGITWRSGLLTAARRRYYTELTDWVELFTIPGITWINLQYDECAAELATAQEKFGVVIHTFAGLDLKNDLDAAAALSSALDLVIGVGNAAQVLAAALGVPTWRIEAHGRSWTSLGSNKMPWFPQVEIFRQPRWGEWPAVFAAVATRLRAMLALSPSPPELVATPEVATLEQIAQLLRAEQWKKARELCYAYLARQPDQHSGWDLCAAAETALGDYHAAVLALERAVALAPKVARYHGHLANALSVLGKNTPAEAAYRTALELEPHWAQAHNDLGNLLRTLGRITEAERCYLSALRYKSDLVEAHNNLGTVLELQGRIAEAEAAYRGALRLRPHFPEAWYNLGNCLGDLARWDEAVSAYREALTLRPSYPQAWMYLGTALKNLKQLPAAEDAYRHALELRPAWTDALNLLANLLMRQERWDDAENLYRAAIKLNPQSHELYSNLGNCLLFAGKHTESEIACREAIRLAPDFAAGWNNLGNALRALGRAPEGQKAFREAIERNPNLADAHSNLGNSLREEEQLTEAEIHDRRAVALRPELAGAWVNLGNTLQTLGKLDEAENCFDRALNLGLDTAIFALGKIRYELGRPEAAEECLAVGLQLKPNDPELNWNLALPRLAQGKLSSGWDNYEFGRWLNTTARRQGFHHFPEWDGSDLTGRTILVYAEQGVGDEILFASCLPEVIAQAGLCIVECDRRLVTLYSRSFPTAAIVGASRNDQDWVREFEVDVEIPIGSLPRFFRRTLADFPARPGYLIPDAERVATFAAQLSGPELKVGITWRSSMTKGMRRRNYSSLSDWGAIFAVPGVRFINLQYDDCAEELTEVSRKFGIEIKSFPELDLMHDLDGAAALSVCMDLVIATGNAAGEIAAAIGVPVWRLESFGRHWTSLGTEQFPWHPQMRIFRQIHWNNWTGVLEIIARDLRAQITGSKEYLPNELKNPPPEHQFQSSQQYKIGLQLQEQDQLDEAINCYYAALRFDPKRADAYNNLGNIYLKRNNLADAENCYRQALGILPNYAEAWSNLGVLLEKRKQKNEALICFQTALDLNGNLFETRYNFANLLQESGDPIQAEEHFRIALSQGIDTALLWNGLALAIRDQMRFSEALECFTVAQQRDPKEERIRWNIGLTYLIMGDLPNGWDGYEWGYNVMRGTLRGFAFPEWDGKYIPDQTLLVYAEQGIGDEILFMSCLSDLLPWVGRCILECEPRLAPLIKRSLPQIEVYGVMREDREWLNQNGVIDYQCPIGSLGYYLRRNLDSFPRRLSYFLPDPEKRLYWRKRLAELDHAQGKITFKVGISWRSRLVGGGRARYYSRLDQWGALFALSEIKFINLQYDDCSTELAEVAHLFGVTIIQFADLDRLNDLDNVAALASALDLVIAPANTVAEIAAAVGIEVWRLDAALPNWPCLGTNYMPWHPTMRLFIQTQLGKWDDILKTMAGELEKRATHSVLNHWIESSAIFPNTQDRTKANLVGKFLAQLVKPGGVVIQIGADQNEITHALAKALGENGWLIIFEEHPGRFRRLQADLFRNGFNRVQCWPEQIGAQVTQLPAWRVCPEDLMHSAHPDADFNWANNLISCRTIDSLNLPASDLFIIDCEGREQEILFGAAQTLERYRPLLSLGSYRYEASASLIAFLETHRYQSLIQEIDAHTILLLAYPMV